MKVFSKKTHDTLRKAAVICGAATCAFGIFAASVDLGQVGGIIAAFLGAVSGFVCYIADHDSDEFFDTRDIVNKVEPDETYAGGEE